MLCAAGFRCLRRSGPVAAQIRDTSGHFGPHLGPILSKVVGWATRCPAHQGESTGNGTHNVDPVPLSWTAPVPTRLIDGCAELTSFALSESPRSLAKWLPSN